MRFFHARTHCTTYVYYRFLLLVTVAVMSSQLSIVSTIGTTSTHVVHAFSLSTYIPSRTNSNTYCYSHIEKESNADVSGKGDKISNEKTRSSSDFSNLKFHKVYLRQTQPSSSPWCYALTVDPTLPSAPEQQTYNFLASQVWPSARVAAATCEEYIMDCIKSDDNNGDDKNKSKSNHRQVQDWKICELGCGPALPSLTLAKLGMNVVATDIDELALFMASKAAQEQNVNEGSFQTKIVDLTANYDDKNEDASIIDEINADLYILSDVFESNHVATGAARMTKKVLERGARVWVFAQSDRAQREVYRVELMKLLNSCDSKGSGVYGELEWRFIKNINVDDKNGDRTKLLLCDLDEVLVDYG